jgi:hypothetical protein
LQSLNDCVPEVKQASDRETREGNSGFRGGGRGRGGGGGGGRGGYFSKGFAAAGLTRQQGNKPNGDSQAS